METFPALLTIFAGNSPVPGEFPAQRPEWRGALMFSLICIWINGWVNSREAGDLRRYRAHYDVTEKPWNMCSGLLWYVLSWLYHQLLVHLCYLINHVQLVTWLGLGNLTIAPVTMKQPWWIWIKQLIFNHNKPQQSSKHTSWKVNVDGNAITICSIGKALYGQLRVLAFQFQLHWVINKWIHLIPFSPRWSWSIFCYVITCLCKFMG